MYYFLYHYYYSIEAEMRRRGASSNNSEGLGAFRFFFKLCKVANESGRGKKNGDHKYDKICKNRLMPLL